MALNADTFKRLRFTSPKDAREIAHNHAIESIDSYNRRDIATSLVTMLDGWNRYAQLHKMQPWNEDQTPIGEDGYFHDPWLQIGQGITQLLNGERGTLDAGKIHSFILETMHSNGFTEKETA